MRFLASAQRWRAGRASSDIHRRPDATMSLNLQSIDDLILDEATKGIPPSSVLRLGDVGRQGWNLLRGDLPLPAAVILESALDHNSRWMQSFLAERQAVIAPHVKTTMCPQIMQRQLDDGAWGVTVATLQQMKVCSRFGARRIVMANQLVGRLELDALVAELAACLDLDFYMLVDSLAGVRAAADAVRRAGASGLRIQVLVERGYPGGRTGCRSNEVALDVARAARAAPELRLCGVEAFEGLIKEDQRPVAEAVAEFLDEVQALFRSCDGERLFEREPAIATAGGSAFYDIVLDKLAGVGAQVITRSGCYVSHDAGLYHTQQQRILEATGRKQGLVSALEVWAYVQSCPEPGLAILTAGRRDCGTDAGLPIPLLLSRAGAKPKALDGCEIIAINDQHAYMRCPPSLVLDIGDRIGLGISHPCTTFDKWDVLYLVNDDYDVIEGLKTFF